MCIPIDVLLHHRMYAGITTGLFLWNPDCVRYGSGYTPVAGPLLALFPLQIVPGRLLKRTVPMVSTFAVKLDRQFQNADLHPKPTIRAPPYTVYPNPALRCLPLASLRI